MSLFESIKDSIAITIADALGKYHKGFFTKRVLKTMDEVEANTNEKNLVSATVVGELYYYLTFPDGTKFYPDIKDGERGFNTDPARGADTFIPFSDGVDFQKASIIKKATNTSNSLGNLSMTLKTTTKHTIITSVKGSSGMGVSNDSIICSDSEAIINNIVSNPRLSGSNSQSHHFVWLVEAKIGSTIAVTVPKNEYASVIETYAIAI